MGMTTLLQIILVLILLQFYCVSGSTNQLKSLRRNPVFKDKNCDGTELFTYDDLTVLQCFGYCSREFSCLGVAFSTSRKRCYGCQRSSFENLQSDKGFSFYQIVPASIAETFAGHKHTEAALPKIGESSGIIPTQFLEAKDGLQSGVWSSPAFCSSGFYAVGFTMRVEPYQGTFSDDTATNAVAFKCYSFKSKSWAGEIRPHNGFWGNWRNFVYCDYANNHVLKAVMTKIEKTDFDVTGLTNLRFQCGDINTIQISETIEVPNMGDTDWGRWGAWSSKCDPGHGICGARIRIMNKAGNGDDTAMNDLVVYCC